MHTQKLFLLTFFTLTASLQSFYKSKSVTKIVPYAATVITAYGVYKLSTTYYQKQAQKNAYLVQQRVIALSKKYSAKLNPSEKELEQEYIVYSNGKYCNNLRNYLFELQRDKAELEQLCTHENAHTLLQRLLPVITTIEHTVPVFDLRAALKQYQSYFELLFTPLPHDALCAHYEGSAYSYLRCLKELNNALGVLEALEPKAFGHAILVESDHFKKNLAALKTYVLGSPHYTKQQSDHRQERLEQKKLAILEMQIATSQQQIQSLSTLYTTLNQLLATHTTELLHHERHLSTPYPLFSSLCGHPQCKERLQNLLKQIQTQEQQRKHTEHIITQQHAELHMVQNMQEHLKNGIHEAFASLQEQINQLKAEKSVQSPNVGQQISPGAEHMQPLPLSASAPHIPHIHYPNLNSPSLQENKQPEGQE